MRWIFLGLLFCANTCMASPYDVGVIDTGVVENDASGLSRTSSQFCFSSSDIQSGFFFSRLSTCQNTTATSFSSARLPRGYTITVPPSLTVNNVAGDRHGSDVLRAIRAVSSDINYIVAILQSVKGRQVIWGIPRVVGYLQADLILFCLVPEI